MGFLLIFAPSAGGPAPSAGFRNSRKTENTPSAGFPKLGKTEKTPLAGFPKLGKNNKPNISNKKQ